MGPKTDAPAGAGESGQEVSPKKPMVATPLAGSAAEPERQANRPSQAWRGVGELAADDTRRVESGAQCQSTERKSNRNSIVANDDNYALAA
jgi:hypothetical protein